MKITFNVKNINKINNEAMLALTDTAESIKTDLIQSQTMPFGDDIVKTYKEYGKRGQFAKNGREYKGKTKKEAIHKGGTLQNDSTFIDDKKVIKGVVKIVSDTPYARKMYFHPEYKFNKSKNRNAGGRWFDTYINGDKKDLPIKHFKKHLKRRIEE